MPLDMSPTAVAERRYGFLASYPSRSCDDEAWMATVKEQFPDVEVVDRDRIAKTYHCWVQVPDAKSQYHCACGATGYQKLGQKRIRVHKTARVGRLNLRPAEASEGWRGRGAKK